MGNYTVETCKESTHGYKKKNGYYCFKNKVGGEWYVHRWVYKMKVGPIESTDVIRHLCNNPVCIEPTHLAKGTHKDNTQDRRNREDTIWHKLSIEQVREIRKKYRFKTQQELADEYRVHRTHIDRIVNGRRW